MVGDLSDRLAPLYKKRGPRDRDTPLAVRGFAGEMEGTPLAYPLDVPGQEAGANTRPSFSSP